ncbi:MAG TPA: hypothetical protein VGR47_18405 [Terracidiphilus sp.]|nr:hypothetical protein [Terracidiphilus sp.]
MNLDTLTDLRRDSRWPGFEGVRRYERLLEDGFEGVQLTTNDPVPEGLRLSYCGLDRINIPPEADATIARHAERGDLCVTVHAGWGLEDDDDAFRIVDAILAAGEKHRIPIFIETHRATITQDLWRTVQLTKRFPEIRFNGDFSHYYCGQELVYGDWKEKLEFLEPVFRRTGFMHGRIASSGCMQVPIDADLNERPAQAHGVADYLEHFRQLWTRAMTGFLSNAKPGDVLIFAPELLAGTYYYARKFPNAAGKLEEETDRYAQALLYRDLARACFAEAVQIQPKGEAGELAKVATKSSGGAGIA